MSCSSLHPVVVADRRRVGSVLAGTDGSTAASPAGTARPARVRSSTRWPTRCSCSGRCFALVDRARVPAGCPVALITVREVAISVYRSLLRPAAAWPCRPRAGQGEDRGAGARRRPGGRCRRLAGHPDGRRLTVLWVAVGLTLGHRCAVPDRRPQRGHHHGLSDRPLVSPACAVKSWPSAPSSCSGRSSTPTRPGSASSWPRPASTRSSRRRSATTSSGIVGRAARRPWPAATRWSCAAASARPRTTSPAPAIARVMGVELVLDPDLVELHPADVLVAQPAHARPTTWRRPTCPKAPAIISPDPRHRARADLPGPWEGTGSRSRRCSTPCPACPTRCRTCSSGRSCPTSDAGRATSAPSSAARCARGATASRAWPSGSPPGSTSSTRTGNGRRWPSSPAASRASRCASPPRRPTEQRGPGHGRGRGGRDLRDLLGDLVFGVDDETMESGGGRRCSAPRATPSGWPSR